MATDLLESKHHVRKAFIINPLAPSLMGDGPVLTEDTTEITVGEKDSPGSIPAHQRNLLAKMGLGAENHDPHRSPAEPRFPLQPIHPTLPGTEVTVFKDCIGLFDPVSEFSLPFQFHVSWLPFPSLPLLGIKRHRGEQ